MTVENCNKAVDKTNRRWGNSQIRYKQLHGHLKRIIKKYLRLDSMYMVKRGHLNSKHVPLWSRLEQFHNNQMLIRLERYKKVSVKYIETMRGLLIL